LYTNKTVKARFRPWLEPFCRFKSFLTLGLKNGHHSLVQIGKGPRDAVATGELIEKRVSI